jgi:hypothetical protein
MNMLKALRLTEKYATCPSCGSDMLGNGAGTLVVDDKTLRRTCACGWGVHVDENDEAVTGNGKG